MSTSPLFLRNYFRLHVVPFGITVTSYRGRSTPENRTS